MNTTPCLHANLKQTLPQKSHFNWYQKSICCLLFVFGVLSAQAKVFDDTMDSLSNWTTVAGANPTLSSTNGALSAVPYMALNNGVVRAELPATITGDWTLRFHASHSAWARGLWAGVFNADGTEGYAVMWDSSQSYLSNGEGIITIRKFSLGSEPAWSNTGSSLSSATASGHGALSVPMAEIELSWEAASGTLSARVDGTLVAAVTDSSFSSFRRIYLRGNTTSYFDNVTIQTVFEEPMDSLSNWSTVTGAGPSLSSSNSSLSSVPYLALNNGVVRAELGSTITGNWTLRFNASHSSWQRGLWAAVLNAQGTKGYGILWDSSLSTLANGEGVVSIRKFSLSSQPAWSTTGSALTSAIPSGHGALSAPMALIELSWDAPSSTLYLSVDGMPITQVNDSSFDTFSRVYLRGNTTSFFDNILLLRDTPPSTSEIGAAINITASPYNAVGDGVTNNQTAITNAIAAANSQGKALYVPPGIFSHSSNLQLNGASIFGHGYISVLAGSDPDNCSVRLSGSNVSVRNCRLTSPNSSIRKTIPEAAAIHVYGASNYNISGCYMEGQASNGIISTNLTSSYGSIYDNWVWNCNADGIHLTQGANNVSLWNNRIRNTGDDMIAVVSYVGQPYFCSDIWIVGNDVRNQPHGRGISCVGGEDVIIEGNYVENSNGSGVYVVSESSYKTYGVNNVSVLNNRIVGGVVDTAHGGIFLKGRSGYPAENILVEGNTILECKSIGIRIAGTTNDVEINNNVITDCVGTGIACFNEPANIILSGNTITKTGHYGIYSDADGSSGYFIIAENLFTDINTIGSESYVDVINIASGSGWSSVTIDDNHYDNPGSYPIERFMEIHFPTASQSGNSTSTNKSIWVGN